MFYSVSELCDAKVSNYADSVWDFCNGHMLVWELEGNKAEGTALAAMGHSAPFRMINGPVVFFVFLFLFLFFLNLKDIYRNNK